jgi:two-component system, LytTR family, response regulator
VPIDLQPVRVLIVDDEPLARSNLTVLLKQELDVEIVGECGSGITAVEAIRHLRPDLVFLDVQMPEGDGFDVIELAGSDLPTAVIFVTAYDEYALRAFDAGAIDYLLKPFDNERFRLALGRAKEKIKLNRETARRDTQRFAIKSGGRVLFIEPAEIDRIEAADYYACLHVKGKTHVIRRSLSDLERDLDCNVFCRIHRSTIVNIHRVRAIESSLSEFEVIVDDGARLKMSRRYRKILQSKMKEIG